ncbi:hypothetical protein BDW74DRAFT_152711 [Aspergillus multicolor]|uniref:uncharacterized protein n=1 Tax=Aspergillus multicolor TaxID=41759 RepID=UPI003CCCEDC6
MEQAAEGCAEPRTDESQSTNTETVEVLLELAIMSRPQSNSNHSSHIITGVGNRKEGSSLSDLDAPPSAHDQPRL